MPSFVILYPYLVAPPSTQALTRKEKMLAKFDPNGIGLKNGNFIGLPFGPDEADLQLLAIPWDVTVSFAEGTSTGAKNIMEASRQLDLYDEDYPNAWQKGIYLEVDPPEIGTGGAKLRARAKKFIDHLESNSLKDSAHFATELKDINAACERMVQLVKGRSGSILDSGKKMGLVGGDHSTPLGYIQALAQRNPDFGILQIDAHMDLRKAYEGFDYSHASIFHNVLQLHEVSALVQVGVRDFCDEEMERSKTDDRIHTHTMNRIRTRMFQGESWDAYTDKIIASLPQKVYISFDIDGLDAKYCPNTGTPVPGGLEINETFYLIKKVVDSGRKIIGFDLCEVAGLGNDWDGNVGARVLYKLCGAILQTNQ